MSQSANGQRSNRAATRLAFLIAGFGIACWAPLVPYAKQRLGVEEGAFGLLLLCIGIGSIVTMTFAGGLSARYGTRRVIVAGGLGLALLLPLLAVASTGLTLAVALLVFGGSLGSIDVAMNIHAAEAETASGKPLMSGFHALFSIGGFAGSGLMTALLAGGFPALGSALACAAIIVLLVFIAWPRLILTRNRDDGHALAMPRGPVVLLSVLAAVIFLAEGAVLDWSALLLTEQGHVEEGQGGIGYILFAVAMTAGRLTGDRLTSGIGDSATLLGGGMLTVLGFVVLLACPITTVALSGFLLIGLGASNIVPVLLRQAGRQKVMPVALAIGAITTLGYAGILAGPAGIGFVAQALGLPAAFWLVAALVCFVPLCATSATRHESEKQSYSAQSGPTKL